MTAHVVPFVAWLAIMLLPGGSTAAGYALRSAVGLALLAALRPWRWYAPLQARHLPLAIAAGSLVFILWVLPETDWFARSLPGVHDAYLRWATDLRRLGRLPGLPGASPFDPAACGWTLALVRLLGSGLVIAPIEEFFWRGFVYRVLAKAEFLEVPLRRFDAPRFLATAALFALEHDRWLAGLAAGCIYGGLAVRTGDLRAAIVAHALTNLMLGLWVLRTGAWGFW